MYLLDTNIISESVKSLPNPKILKWLSELPTDNLFVSVLTLGEIRKGVELVKNSQQRNKLKHWLEVVLVEFLGDRMIEINSDITDKWGYISSQSKNLPAIDGLIAATALVSNLKLVTRNVKDFEKVKGLEIINPFL